MTGPGWDLFHSRFIFLLIFLRPYFETFFLMDT